MNVSTITAQTDKSVASIRRRIHENGVGLVEVLVALIVLSVGLLGIASMYVTTLQAKTTSGSRMKAVNLAYDIADRMRANPAGVNDGGTYDYTLAIPTSSPNPDCLATSAICTPAQIAATDLYQWSQAIANKTTGLPGGTAANGTVVQNAAPTSTTPGIYTITISWIESTGATPSYSLQVQL